MVLSLDINHRHEKWLSHDLSLTKDIISLLAIQKSAISEQR